LCRDAALARAERAVGVDVVPKLRQVGLIEHETGLIGIGGHGVFSFLNKMFYGTNKVACAD
jgi:hypothetical protein